MGTVVIVGIGRQPDAGSGFPGRLPVTRAAEAVSLPEPVEPDEDSPSGWSGLEDDGAAEPSTMRWDAVDSPGGGAGDPVDRQAGRKGRRTQDDGAGRRKGSNKDERRSGKKGSKKGSKKDRPGDRTPDAPVRPAPASTAADAPDVAMDPLSESAAAGAVTPAAPPDPNTIGIVFIAGIGSAKPGETLLSWSRPLLRLLSAWATTTYGVRPQNDQTGSANMDFSGISRSYVVASVPALGAHPGQTWIMTEAWWAARVDAPSVGALVRWLPGELIRIWMAILSGTGGAGSALFKVVDFVFLPLFLVPAALLVTLAYLLLRLLRAVPWRPVQEAATRSAIRLFLADRLTDARVLLTDRIQAANARARIAEAIRDCEAAGCGTIVLVGHGAGAIAGYMTLADETYATLPASELITCGQALGTVWRMGHADEYDVPDREADRLYRGDRLRGNLSRLPYRGNLRWHDFWATHDPAAAGGLEASTRVTTPELVNGASTRVFNRMSLRNDHAGYWDNDEEFVLTVARLIDVAPEVAPAISRFFPESRVTGRSERRRQRVRLLQFAWIPVILSAALALPLAILGPLSAGGRSSVETAGAAAWSGLGSLVDGVRPFLRSMRLDPALGGIDRSAAALIGTILLLVAYRVVAATMSGLWTAWDARERVIALQPIPRWRSALPLAAQLGLCAGAGVWLLVLVGTGDWMVAAPAVGALILARAMGAVTGRGAIRRPIDRELAQADVLP